MPRLDQTGPLGRGPMTGRGFGPCGMGYGYSFGCCGRRIFTRGEEKEILESDIKTLEEDLKAAKERLEEISQS